MTTHAVTCLEFRQRVGAEPNAHDAALAAHRLACRGCAAFAREAQALDRSIAAALAVPVPAGLDHRVILRATATPARSAAPWVALAASLVVAVTAGAFWWSAARAPQSLGAEVIAHARHEPASWIAGVQPVAEVEVRRVLAAGEAELVDAAQLGVVNYATVCPLRGRKVPHLTVQSVAGPAMVLLLPHEPLAREQPLDEDGLHGVLVPVGDGAIAIIAPDPRAIEAVRSRVARATALGI